MLNEIAIKHGYVELNALEAKQSNATHQHKRAHGDHERFALTLLIDGEDWTHRDDRGDDDEGTGSQALDAFLTRFHADDEG